MDEPKQPANEQGDGNTPEQSTAQPTLLETTAEIPDGGLLNHPVVTPSDANPPRGNGFPVVGIGASAGGLDAFTQLLRALPDDTGMAFVLVQHMDPSHASQLQELLAPITGMPVVTVQNGARVEPDHVYIIPPNASMVITDGHLRLLERLPGLHLPVDIFFRSLAESQGSRAIGVVLSGNAADGSSGIRAIKGECGLTFAQDENTARFSGMPRAAVATGAVDFILPPAEIGRELARVASNPYLVPNTPEAHEILPEGDRDLRQIFAMVEAVTKVDFTHYKMTTVRRRISRRMMVHRLDSVGEYLRLLQQRPEEIRELYLDLLISVTRFFREPETFEALVKLLRASLPGRSGEDPFRVWVPGCATGEEVYSLAICLEELAADMKLPLPIRLFGTDISETALERARAGVYSEIISHDVSPERLQSRFTRTDGGFRISKSIREQCVFARQDLTRDPPFSHIDLISCRNLLIYLDSTLQRHILPVFHYALKPSALLILGSAESITTASDLFSVVDREHRIFARREAPTRVTMDLRSRRTAALPGEAAGAAPSGSDLLRRVDRVIQSRYSPDAVVVDSDLQIIQFRGHTSVYLDPAPGEASLDLRRMAREPLLLPLRRLINEAGKKNEPVSESGIALMYSGERHLVRIEVTPLAGRAAGERYYVIVFQDVPAPGQPRSESETAERSPDTMPGVARLEQELAEAHDYLRTLTEDHEASSEELRAANEEVRSSNEELQSTNEELGTTKEELQSANEELTTLNEELHIRNAELSSSNSDLSNLLSAVNIPILMVDNDLRLRRFTAPAEKLLDLTPIDIGRPLRQLGVHLNIHDIEQTTRSVIENLDIHQEEVQTRDGTWYAVTVRPYRTLDNRIDGAVLTFQDIDPLKRSLTLAEEARDYAEGMIETVREPLLVLDSDLRVLRATASFYESFQVSREETLGRFFYDLGNGQWNRARLRELLGNALYKDQPFQDYEVTHNFPHLGVRTMRLNGRPIAHTGSEPHVVLVAVEDLTERREEAEVRYRRLFETAKDGMLVLDAETGNILDVNPFFLELTGCLREEVIGRPLENIRAFQSTEMFGSLIPEVLEHEVVRYDEVELRNRQREKLITDIVANRYMIGGQTVIQINVRDVTQRKRAEAALRESEERFRLFVESLHDYAIFQVDLQGRIISWNAGAQRVLGYAADEIVGRSTALIFTPEDVQKGEHLRELEKARTEGRAEDERWHLRNDGSRFFASGVLTQVRDQSGRLLGFAKVMRDNTARQQLEEELRASVREKDVLLKEIHHRVKNNLQVITSLLNLQSEHVTDPALMDLLAETRSRIHSLGTIHEFVYRSSTLSRIDFREYVNRLVQDLLALYGADPKRTDVSIVGEHASLDLAEAVPAGLIVNELLTNSLKHAFPNGASGKVTVAFRCSPENCTLEVFDNGAGLPQDLDPAAADSMGLQLVYLLAEQLQGSVELDRKNGTRFSVTFPRTTSADDV